MYTTTDKLNQLINQAYTDFTEVNKTNDLNNRCYIIEKDNICYFCVLTELDSMYATSFVFSRI